MKWGVVLACSYEVVSITTGRTPTFTQLCRRYPLLRPVILGVLAVHLARQPKEAQP